MGSECTPEILLREFEPFVLKYIDESLAWPDIICPSNVADKEGHFIRVIL